MFSSPPLLKRSVGSPFSTAVPATPDASLHDVSRSLPFDREELSSPVADGAGQPHRSVKFLIVAACIKPILAASFVAVTPSLSLAGAHVRLRLNVKCCGDDCVTRSSQVYSGCQRFLMMHLNDAHPFFSTVQSTLQGVIDLCRSTIIAVSRRSKYVRLLFCPIDFGVSFIVGHSWAGSAASTQTPLAILSTLPRAHLYPSILHRRMRVQIRSAFVT
jgi:hypothetical protein